MSLYACVQFWRRLHARARMQLRRCRLDPPTCCCCTTSTCTVMAEAGSPSLERTREAFTSDTDSSEWESGLEEETDSDSTSDDSSSDSTDSSVSEELHYSFVEEPSQDIYCPVTLDVLLDPCQTLCCGNHLSLSAAHKLKRMKKRCPLCKKFPLAFVEDKYFQRVVLATKLYCSNKESGCQWTGEVRELKSHLNVGCVDYRGKCGFVEIPCPYKCGSSIQRLMMEDHKAQDCLKRPFSCPHCNYNGTYDTINRDHWPKCKKFPLQCPNTCGSGVIQRRLLKRHLSQDCPLQEVECEFSYAGCSSRVKRCKLNEHMEDNIQYHLQSLAKCTLQLHVHACNYLSSSREIVFQNFEQHRLENREWYSSPFYTGIGGYKMCLGIDANGYCRGPSRHLGVAVYMMRGEFDRLLQWPFRGVISVELVDQNGGGKNYSVDIVEEASHSERDYMDIFSKVTKGERRREGWGLAEFISHKCLYKPKQGRKYIYNDSVHFKVAKVIVQTII